VRSVSEWPNALSIVVAALAYKAATMALLPIPSPAPAGGIGDALSALMADPVSLWKLVAIPLASSLLHWDTLLVQFGSAQPALAAVAVIGVVLAAAHAWFWWSVWSTLASSRTTAFAAALMLFVYGLWAGIVIGRVPVFGIEYLWQHRYITFFQLAIAAIALQWIAASSAAARRGSIALVAVVLGLSAWIQSTASDRAWDRVPYVRAHWTTVAGAVYCLARHPDASAVSCPAMLAACDWAPDVRNRLVALLRDQQLNVFSPAMQQRYQWRPEVEGSDSCLTPAES
jgi:hypothetical protein